ncbi:hypothetical protein BJV78DRAFT_1353369 [Lactifluus subvellereus]|nr:hypothetical protein BJV78DRAFT_1353369 [Lactifluus subvellereus]
MDYTQRRGTVEGRRLGCLVFGSEDEDEPLAFGTGQTFEFCPIIPTSNSRHLKTRGKNPDALNSWHSSGSPPVLSPLAVVLVNDVMEFAKPPGFRLALCKDSKILRIVAGEVPPPAELKLQSRFPVSLREATNLDVANRESNQLGSAAIVIFRTRVEISRTLKLRRHQHKTGRGSKRQALAWFGNDRDRTDVYNAIRLRPTH